MNGKTDFLMCDSPLFRKSKSQQQCAHHMTNRKSANVQFNALSDFTMLIDSPKIQKKLTVDLLVNYAGQIIKEVYHQDPLAIGQMLLEFMSRNLSKIRPRLQQRLSLLAYLGESLKYKLFSEIEPAIIKQWRKNVLFFTINTIWSTKMQAHLFLTAEQFIQEYHKQKVLVANLTHFYFRSALSLLNAKQVATFSFIQEDTAHQILNSLPDWKDLYHAQLLPLLNRTNHRNQMEVNIEFDVSTLEINEQYLDISGEDQLVRTTELIKSFAFQHTIHGKIKLLRLIRAAFLEEIQKSRQEIAQKKVQTQIRTLEKDDIIGCMIYCNVVGRIHNLQASLQALSFLLGKQSELLSKKGVDSYRADLQSATQYLCEQSEQFYSNAPKQTQIQSTFFQFSLGTV